MYQGRKGSKGFMKGGKDVSCIKEVKGVSRE